MAHAISLFIRCKWFMAFIVCLVLGAAAQAAQNDNTAPGEAAAALLREAYQQSRTAESEQECDRVLALCREALTSGPGQQGRDYAQRLMAWTHNKRGELVAAEGREEDALEDFESAIGLDDGRWTYLHNRAVSFALLGRRDEALRDFDRVLDLKPDAAKAHFNRGELLYQMGRFEDAVRNYDEAIRHDDRDAGAYAARGHAHYRLGGLAAAERDFSRAIRLDPENAAAYTHRGDLRAEQGNFAAAAQDYRAAIESNAEFGAAYQSAAWLASTCPDSRFRVAPLAVELARRAIELDGEENYRYLETFAAALANAGDFDEARQVQSRVIELIESSAPGELVDRQRARLALYSQDRPFRAVRGPNR